ncbi:MAG: helix-turn-helix domain-containing protein [Casimicrobiaceae bacterium]
MNAPAASVGTWLRVAREAAGLSGDAVAQQLKLHPRQVRAIEEDDFARLPGRTFVRGFVRNYARLVNLDADAVVAALPTGESTSPLERLTYTPSSRPMGEIPLESPRRRGRAARWLIPLVLLTAVAVAAYFEFLRPPTPRPVTPDGIMPPPAPKAPTPSGPAVTPLPNPLDAPKSETAAPVVAAVDLAPAPAPAPATPASAPSPASATTQPQSVATVPTTTTAPATSATPSPTLPAAAAVPAASATPVIAAPIVAAPAVATTAPVSAATRTEAATDSTLVLSFTGTSWVRVKDDSGAVLLAQSATAGATLPVVGRPPFDVVIGNADRVRAQFRGQPVDLTPHTRFNVARFVLQ